MAKTTKNDSNSKGQDDVTLDSVLIALQKSFSRVSDETNNKYLDDNEASLARINGQIKFEISLNVKPEDDKLLFSEVPENSVRLNLTGTINPDIKEEEELNN